MSTRYHRLARETPAYAWWKLPVAGLLGVAIYFALTVILLLIAALVFVIAGDSGGVGDWLDSAGTLDLEQLDFFVLDMLGLAILIPAVFLAVLVTGPRPIGYLSSVVGRLRWRWLARTAVMAFIVFIVTIIGSLLINEMSDPAEVDGPSNIGRHAVVAILLVLLVTPFQAAAEEYVFRGYLMQLVGSWSRFAMIPIAVSVPLFVAGHEYELWGLLDVGIFGLTAAVLTIRSGGLEAAIAAHTANNVVLFVLDALGVLSASDDSGAGPIDLIPTVVSSVVFLVWVEWAVRRHGIARTRAPIPVPPPPPLPMWPPPPYAMAWWPPPAWPPPPPAWGPPHPAVRVPVPARYHPNTPSYPGELPPDWGSN